MASTRADRKAGGKFRQKHQKYLGTKLSDYRNVLFFSIERFHGKRHSAVLDSTESVYLLCPEFAVFQVELNPSKAGRFRGFGGRDDPGFEHGEQGGVAEEIGTTYR